MFQPGLLKDKRVLITGGGTGLGRSIGQRYLELGADLVICGRRKEVLEETARELSAQTGGRVTPIQCDVRDAAMVEPMMETIWQTAPLDILINNAAGNFLAQTHKLSPRAIDSVLNIVLHGAAYCTVAAGRRWIEAQHKGVVLSILTLSALNGAPFTVPSAMAKAGVLAMTKSLAVEWGPKGIRLVAVAPGPFPTPGAWQRLMPEERTKADPIENSIPLRRVGQHEELANLCSFLVSDQAGYINGDCIVIDGGKMLQSGGGGVNTAGMLDWSDAQWDAIKPKK
jgi:NAD(P)-dependent dehydrogenase (short-subunit alcohol dehydrogenase family)